jgi:rhodanese-related sulfurtransferase
MKDHPEMASKKNTKPAKVNAPALKNQSAKPQNVQKRQQLPAALWVGIVLLALAVIGGVVLIGGRNAAPVSAANAAVQNGLPAEISVREAAAKRDSGAFVLDVREPYEWAEIHVPGATLIPLGQLAARVAEVPKDREVVVICRSGNRSQEGRNILKRAGFTNVTSVAGGIRQWSAAGLPTVSGQ